MSTTSLPISTLPDIALYIAETYGFAPVSYVDTSNGRPHTEFDSIDEYAVFVLSDQDGHQFPISNAELVLFTSILERRHAQEL